MDGRLAAWREKQKKCSTTADAKKSLTILRKSRWHFFKHLSGCYNQTVLIRNHSVNNFVKETRCGVGKSLLEFSSGRGVSLDDNFPPKKLCHKIKNIYELQSLMKKSLSSQELSLAETKVKELAVLRH